MENAIPLIDTAPSSNGYIVNFVVKEPKAFSLGLKAGISTNGDADMSLNAGKQSVGGRGEAVNTSYTYTVKMWRTLRATDDSAFSVREHAGHTMKFSMENAIAFDTRDRPILASRGILARLTQEYAGPFGDSSFIRHQLDLQAAAPLPLGLILSASAQLKNVKGLGDREVHLLDRVYLGGQQDVRGFGLNTLGVRSENSCLGGGTAACGVLHLYRPLFPPQVNYN
ncbi:hypothetical protein ANCDUO_11603 [Ancylostoma duodenale]|uniref:Bacterial surface antigen (D15) domain-containing protein n=1 Tax=Ancylostoma duodenale TaxID=51022 RepID=A0A0C2GB33_9BILA|nr:hypothetical protein ANCDUO_11603 [Ancylostoma duodenale]